MKKRNRSAGGRGFGGAATRFAVRLAAAFTHDFWLKALALALAIVAYVALQEEAEKEKPLLPVPAAMAGGQTAAEKDAKAQGAGAANAKEGKTPDGPRAKRKRNGQG